MPRNVKVKVGLVSECAAEGFTIPETAELLSTSYSSIDYLRKRHEIRFASGKNGTKRRPEIDALLTGMFSLEEIAARVGPARQTRKTSNHLTRARIQQYVAKTGQNEEFLRRREEYSKSKKEQNAAEMLREGAEKSAHIGNLAWLLRQEALQMADSISWPHLKAAEYYLKRQSRMKSGIPQEDSANIPFDRIVGLFRIYSHAKDSGENISVPELERRCGVYRGSITKIFKAVGVESLIKSSNYGRIPQEKKEAMDRVHGMDVPIADIAYFLELHYSSVRNYLEKRFGGLADRITFLRKFGNNEGKVENFTYCKASEIYLATDLGFTRDDAIILLDNTKMVDYAIAERESIAPKIVGFLNVLLPERGIEKPYL